MKRRVDHDAMAVAGYTDPWIAPPGQAVRLHMSVDGAIRDMRVIRLDLPVPEVLPWPVSKLDAPVVQDLERGSFLEIVGDDLPQLGTIRTLSFELYLTSNAGQRTVVAMGGLRILLDADGLSLHCADGDVRSHSIAVPARSWLDVTMTIAGRSVTLTVTSGDILAPLDHTVRLDVTTCERSGAGILFGTAGDDATPSLNARFAGVRLIGDAGLAAWRFPTIAPKGPMLSSGNPPLRILARNLPTHCVTSRRWDGSSFDPRLVPDHYDAIHCHADDWGPLAWKASHEVTVPRDAASGVYAVELVTDRGAERIVFFVRTADRRAAIAFLVPTATYLAYADEALPPHLFAWKCDDRGHRFAVANGLLSLYDYHEDRSGVSITSWRKPKATLRDDYRYPLCGCPHNLPVDLHLLRFCHANDVAFDLITDHDLHERGDAALAGYGTVMTGSHPEYMSVEMEQSLRQFAAQGGSIAYLGGNGFASVVAFRDDLMELRRSPLEAGRTWDGPIGEQALALTNEPGGFLRSRGRGEFSLTGVAISLMGFDDARPFRRTERSHGTEFAWLFEGVEEESFGHAGMVLGGAAGYEVDATDIHLGTPCDVVVLARATGFGDSFFHDPARWYEGGEEEMNARRCAEMTLRVLPAGGMIFSASSVAWCGALPHGGDMNDVGRITLNLLRRLSTARP